MLITDGLKTRNISPGQLPEYTAKGYAKVNEAGADEAGKKPVAKKPKD